MNSIHISIYCSPNDNTVITSFNSPLVDPCGLYCNGILYSEEFSIPMYGDNTVKESIEVSVS